ncbi:MAG: glycosyltransferase [Desulfuromonadales bacterium]|nr:MAG: glycosyltransferase [Desulfuromonadales bacterium]
MTNTSVTIIIPTYNRAHFLPECLKALFAQTVRASEVIVINDGSTDGTTGAIAPYRGRIIYLEKQNGGKASALNVGMAQATGEFIWICDDDDISLPDALELHLKKFESEPSADFTYSGYLVGVPNKETNEIQIIESCGPFKGVYNKLFLSFASGAAGPGIGFMSQQGMLVRKRCYDAAGPFDETLTRSEDFDMNLRLCRAFKGVPIERPTFIIRCHDGERGPSFDLHSIEKREARLLETDQAVLRKLYENVELYEYVDGNGSNDLKTFRRVEALLTRARIFANWYLDDLVMDDLSQLQVLVREGASSIDESTMNGIFYLESLYERRGKKKYSKSINKIAQNLVCLPGGDEHFSRTAARYYFWKALESFRKGERARAFQSLLSSTKIMVLRHFPFSRLTRRGCNNDMPRDLRNG